MIEHYDFGEIVVNGKRYLRDLIITPNRIIANWWRKEGHKLSLEDLEDVLHEEADAIVIGTGYYGLMEVDDEVKEYFERKGIKVIVKPSCEAVIEYNNLVFKGMKVIGAFHLTC